ncbi:DUF1064 domain-containing protein [Brevibacillus ruminantium]|uniref:DUF1064 domain-containing protein n=1 Tax=Brevibacillus ruminantium TaxID=2950604 RepID=A0ABY4WAZ7_9BACL|nr:DUF1064 domain-containing protein [Brevibacillus ruminantium]USG64021.1 DUF1064 domain-containing protein [Brevibacillus ruminantium]
MNRFKSQVNADDQQPKRSKYKNKKTVVDGITFDSKAESEYYLVLKEMLAAGEIKDMRLQPVYVLQEKCVRNGKKLQAITYKADFEVLHLNGTLEVIDIKGEETEAFKIKAKMFQYKYPNMKLTLLKKVMKYGGWITTDEWKEKKRAEKKAI